MHKSEESNGEKKILYWIAGILASLLLAIVSIVANSYVSRNETTQKQDSEHLQRTASLEQSHKEIMRRLERIELKIDSKFQGR